MNGSSIPAGESSFSWLYTTYLLPIVNLLTPILIGAALLSVIASLAITRTFKKPFWSKLGFFLPFALLGAVAGLLAGASREPIVGGLLTGLMAIGAALITNYYLKDSREEFGPSLPPAIVLLCLSAVVSLGLGSVQRADREDYDRRFARWKAEFENVDVPLMLIRSRYTLCRQRIARERIERCDEILVK